MEARAAPAPPPAAVPVPHHAPPPVYPRRSRLSYEEGEVVLRLWIERDGGVSRVEVLTSSGHARLDQAACEALATWRFDQAQLGGTRTFDHTVVFRLAD